MGWADRGNGVSTGRVRVPVKGVQYGLQPIRPRDYEALYELEVGSFLGPRWRQRGHTPSFDSFVSNLWAGVLAQYLVVETPNGRAVGYVSAYNPDLKNGWAYLALAKFRPDDLSGGILAGAMLFISRVFQAFPLRKLYAEVDENAYAEIASGDGTIFTIEGRLTQHTFHEGRYHDELILAIDRAQWQAVEERYLPASTRAAIEVSA